MPMHPDFIKIKRRMMKDYGKEKGEDVYYQWVNKHGYDDTKPLDKQKSKASIDEPLLELFEAEAAMKGVSIPAYRTLYTATLKTESEDSPLILKSLVLEQGANVNKWSVDEKEFPKVAEQYKAGRQLRINHSKDVQDVIGKSFDAKVLKGSEVETYLGRKLDGVEPNGLYIGVDFETNPQDLQVRTNLLAGYVDTGSIGLDATPYCAKCGEKLDAVGDTFERPCHHLDANIILRDVEVKEYSYVAEPAFPHTKLFPSFAAAVSEIIKESSLSETKPLIQSSMPDNPKTNDPPPSNSTIEVTAKKSDAEGDASALSKAYAESEYKRGLAEGRLKAYEEAAKKAEGEDDDEEDEHMKKKAAESKKKAEASTQTDQVTKAISDGVKPKNDWLANILSPESNLKADSAMTSLFKGAAEAHGCPPEVKARIRSVFK